MARLSLKLEVEVEKCKNCEWKILNDGIKGCNDCKCSCHPKAKSWEEYERTLNKDEITELELKPRQYLIRDNKLIIKDYKP